MAKKKALLGVVCLAMVALIAVFGTVAFLTDRDSETNVFTSGDVSIDLKEDYTQGSALLPGVDVDKTVTIANTGKNDAWVWYTYAIPVELADYVNVYGNDNWIVYKETNTDPLAVAPYTDTLAVDNVSDEYKVFTCLLKDPLKVDASVTGMTGVEFDETADYYNGAYYSVENGKAEKIGDWDLSNVLILVSAYAIQVEEFDTVKAAYKAYSTQWGENGYPEYKKNGVVTNQDELKAALENGTTEITVVASFAIDETIEIPAGVTINGNGNTITRATGFTGTMFTVADNSTLTLENVTVDGGAVWTGAVDPVLGRGTVNSGMTASGAIVAAEANSKIVLEEGAVLQNNAGANAVNLGTRVGATLTINGGEIINNSSAAGAIWGGGEITLNSGKVNGNYGDLGGAIRVVTNVGTVLTMNGGEMNHNYSAAVGGAIWAGSSKSNNVYVLNGGEMAYNYSAVAGGAMYPGYYETVNIGGTFKMHDNSAPTAGAIRFHNHASLVMTGGEIYDNGENSLFLLNNSASITGGKISDNFGYGGGLGLTVGAADINGVIAYDLSTTHNTAYLAADFNGFKFTVAEGSNFANFNFKPAAGYTYTAGDETKLVCMNEGYETYWDAASGTFKLKAK